MALTSEGDVVVLDGYSLRKYDKDFNLIKEVKTNSEETTGEEGQALDTQEDGE